MRWSVWLGAALFCASVYGASIYKRSLNGKTGDYMTDGVFSGGVAGTGYSLLNVRHEISKKLGMERIVLDMGDNQGKPLLDGLGYFQVAVDKIPRRIVVNLAQITMSKISEQRLKEVFSKSPYVGSVALNEDPEDHSVRMVLGLKSPMKAEVFKLHSKGRPNRIVIDLKTL